MRAVRDDVTVMAAILRRVENNQHSENEIWQGLFEALRSTYADRVDTLESRP